MDLAPNLPAFAHLVPAEDYLRYRAQMDALSTQIERAANHSRKSSSCTCHSGPPDRHQAETPAVLPTPVPATPAVAPTHGTEPCIGAPECFTVAPLSILWSRVVDDREHPLSTFSWAIPLPAARLDARLPPSSPVPVASPVGLADGPKPRVGTSERFDGDPESCGGYAVTFFTDCTCQEWPEWE